MYEDHIATKNVQCNYYALYGQFVHYVKWALIAIFLAQKWHALEKYADTCATSNSCNTLVAISLFAVLDTTTACEGTFPRLHVLKADTGALVPSGHNN